MMRSEQINELVSALALAQMNYAPVVKDSENPFFHSNYADLAACIDGTKKALYENGLAVSQITEVRGAEVILITMLMHKSGQYIAGEYPIRPIKADPQGYGAAMTYARRYTYSGIIGLAAEDDDGEAASGRPHQTAGNTHKTDASQKPVQSTPQGRTEPKQAGKPEKAIDDEKQIRAGLVNSTLVAELKGAVKNRGIDPADFMIWLAVYLQALGIKCIGIDSIPSTIYAEILATVKSDNGEIKQGADEWRKKQDKEAKAASGDGVK